MDFVEMHLQDVESNEKYVLKVSPADAVKAENDIAFATALLNYARENAKQNETSDVLTLSTPPDSVSLNVDEELVEGFRWSHEAILLLLEEYRQREQDMSLGRITHKKVWDQIAEVMNSKGYFVTGRQCSTRINTMKRTYKTVKDHNKKSGNDKRSWKYFEMMDSLLGHKPYMMPLSTISSSGEETFNSAASTSSMSSLDICDKENDEYINLSHKSACKRKRKTDNITQAILENQRIAEENREKRHKEKMEAKEKLMTKLDNILMKL